MDGPGGLAAEDVREALRLVNAVHALTDAPARKQRFLDGLCTLFQASACASVVTHVPCSGSLTIIASLQSGPRQGGDAIAADAERDADACCRAIAAIPPRDATPCGDHDTARRRATTARGV